MASEIWQMALIRRPASAITLSTGRVNVRHSVRVIGTQWP